LEEARLSKIIVAMTGRTSKDNIDIEVRRYEHLQSTYKDTDFINAVNTLRTKLLAKYGERVSFQIDSAKDNKDNQKIIALADRWIMSIKDLAYFADGYSGRTTAAPPEKDRVTVIEGRRRIHVLPIPHPIVNATKDIRITTSDDGDKILIEIGPYATQKDLIANWSGVKFAQKLIYGERKRKPAENYELIHAIFKARMKGKNFLAIHSQYLYDKLPGYSKEQGHAKRFTDHKILERYYDRHKPILSDG
jgi:hypothetical protein